MRAWEVQGEWGLDHLAMVEREKPVAAAGQVVVRMRAAAINYRDLLTVQGMGGTRRLPLVPFSDGAGEVIAVGEGVTRARIGDKVCPMFFQSWKDGPPDAAKRARPLGGRCPACCRTRWRLTPIMFPRSPAAGPSRKQPPCPAPASPRGVR